MRSATCRCRVQKRAPGARGNRVRPPAGGRDQTTRDDRLGTTASPAHLSPDYRPEARHTRKFYRRLRECACAPLEASSRAAKARPIFGPFEVERGLTTIMRSATGFEQNEAPHVRQSELCATCHTLITKALGRGGSGRRDPRTGPLLGVAPQRPYSEQRGCQSCHMPAVEQETPSRRCWAPRE